MLHVAIMASFPNETKLEMLSDVGAIAGRIQDFTHRVTLFSNEVEAVLLMLLVTSRWM